MSKKTTELSPSELISNGVLRAAEELGLRGKLVARIIGISEASFSRLRNGSWRIQQGTKTYELAMMLVRIHHTLKTVMQGNLDRMRSWLSARNDSLGAAPLEQLSRITGLINVLTCVERLKPAT